MSSQNVEEFFQSIKTDIARLKNDLRDLLGAISGDEAKQSKLLGLLITKYSEKHRAYHNLSHISLLLASAAEFRKKFADSESVRLAIWFHDVIYEPQSANNEAESAALAVESLAELGFPKEKIEKVERMILATQKHDAANLDWDGRMFLDLDLKILSIYPSAYKKYAQAIRAEYSFVPENLYRRERCKILQRFLQREFIYYTDEMRKTYEESARRNIANEIKDLS